MRKARNWWTTVVVMASLGLLAACNGDDDSSGTKTATPTASATATSTASPTPTPVVPSDLAAGWNVFFPGGETTCARGTEYAYAVHKGAVNKLVVDFMGGGACWNALTCSFGGSLFNEEIDPDQLEGQAGAGIYDKTNPDNPVKDWYHVFIPYCTGDVHWGDNVVEYEFGGEEFTIQHRGFVNASAVLEWVYDNFSAPETILVTGCSAGAYGSIGWAPHIMQHYGDSQVYQLGDSGAGIVTDNFFRNSFPSWKAEGAMPAFIPGLNPENVDILDLALADFYGEVGRFFPANLVSMYNSSFDENQVFFYEAMGGEGGAESWSEQMGAMVVDAHAQAANLYSYTAPGEQHCIIPYDEFYTVEAGGVRLVDWVDDMLNGRPIESSVQCVDCDRPTGG